MKKPNITAGPWNINGVHCIPDIVETGDGPHNAIRSEGDRWVALVEITDSEGESNARAIAAVPQLLEALECVARGRTDGQKERGETLQSMALAALTAAGYEF